VAGHGHVNVDGGRSTTPAPKCRALASGFANAHDQQSGRPSSCSTTWTSRTPPQTTLYRCTAPRSMYSRRTPGRAGMSAASSAPLLPPHQEHPQAPREDCRAATSRRVSSIYSCGRRAVLTLHAQRSCRSTTCRSTRTQPARQDSRYRSPCRLRTPSTADLRGRPQHCRRSMRCSRGSGRACTGTGRRELHRPRRALDPRGAPDLRHPQGIRQSTCRSGLCSRHTRCVRPSPRSTSSSTQTSDSSSRGTRTTHCRPRTSRYRLRTLVAYLRRWPGPPNMRSASTTLSPKLSVSHAPLPDDFNTRPLTVLFMDAVGLLGTFILRDRFREPCCLVSSFFFSASEDRTACHWDASTGKGTIFIREQAFSITDMDASPESQSVVASPRNGQTHVVDPGVRTGAEQSSSGVNAIRLFPCSSDGVLVAACGPGTLLRIWAAKTGEVGSTFRGAGSQSSASALSPDSSRNIMTYGNNSHDVWYTGYDFVRPTSPS
jgi:hypothetical protein